jgi:hypothetical protein
MHFNWRSLFLVALSLLLVVPLTRVLRFGPLCTYRQAEGVPIGRHMTFILWNQMSFLVYFLQVSFRRISFRGKLRCTKQCQQVNLKN